MSYNILIIVVINDVVFNIFLKDKQMTSSRKNFNLTGQIFLHLIYKTNIHTV
jgi:hypothetical protein